MFKFGKYKGLSLKKIYITDRNYCNWLCGKDWFQKNFNDDWAQLTIFIPKEIEIENKPLIIAKSYNLFIKKIKEKYECNYMHQKKKYNNFIEIGKKITSGDRRENISTKRIYFEIDENNIYKEKSKKDSKLLENIYEKKLIENITKIFK